MKTGHIFRILYWAIPALLIYDAISILVSISIHALDPPIEFQSFETIGYFLFGKIQEGLSGLFFLILDAALRFAIVFLFVNRYKHAPVISLIFSVYWIANLVFPSMLLGIWTTFIASGTVTALSLVLIIWRKINENEN